jgi:hypothetical protein
LETPRVYPHPCYSLTLAGFLGVKDNSDSYYIDARTGKPTITRNATRVKQLSIAGVRYSSMDVLQRDSYIIFQRSVGIDSEQLAGQIQSIFSHQRRRPDGSIVDEIFFMVTAFDPLMGPDLTADKYRGFGFAGGHMCYDRMGAEEILEAKNILCHFAKTDFEYNETKFIHILPLNRVSSWIHLMPLISIHHLLLANGGCEHPFYVVQRGPGYVGFG